MIKAIFILCLMLFSCSVFAGDDEYPIFSVEGILQNMSDDLSVEEGSLEQKCISGITSTIPVAIELGLTAFDHIQKPTGTFIPGGITRVAPRPGAPVIGSHRMGPKSTLDSLGELLPGADNIRRILYTTYDILSQIEDFTDPVAIILTILGEIIKEVISELVEQAIAGLMAAIDCPPIVKEFIGTLIGELISYFIIDPMVDEMINFATEIING